MPAIRLEVADSTGVEAIRAEYSPVTAGGDMSSGQQRPAMDPAGLMVFHDSIRLMLARGDEVRFRLLAVDFDGNESVAPADTSQACLIRAIRHLAGVLHQATLSGPWEATATGGCAATGTAADPASSSLMQPFPIVGGASDAALRVSHAYQFDNRSGGNLKVAADGGANWSVIALQRG